MRRESLRWGGRRRLFFTRRALHHRFHWTDQDMSVAAFQSRLPFHGAVGRQIAREPDEQFLAQVGVCDLTPTELHHRFDPIPFLKKTDGVVLLEVVVVIVGVGPELELLHLHHVLLLFGVVLLLLLLVLVMPVVHRLGDGRNGRGRYQHQVKAQLLSLPKRRRGRHHIVGAIGKHGPDFARPDRLIYILSAILPAGGKISGWIHFGLYV